MMNMWVKQRETTAELNAGNLTGDKKQIYFAVCGMWKTPDEKRNHRIRGMTRLSCWMDRTTPQNKV